MLFNPKQFLPKQNPKSFISDLRNKPSEAPGLKDPTVKQEAGWLLKKSLSFFSPLRIMFSLSAADGGHRVPELRSRRRVRVPPGGRSLYRAEHGGKLLSCVTETR